jgi:DNA-binding transcriptional LysR family regulator
LGISQPAISKHIKALEVSLGSRVFERARGCSARLSAEGEALVTVAREMVAQRRALKARRGEEEHRTYRVAARGYVLDSFIKPALSDFYLRYPGLTIEVEEINDGQEIARRLREGRADLGIYTEDERSINANYMETLGVLTYSLYASPDTAARIGADIDLISSEPLIIISDPKFEEWVQRALRQVGIVPLANITRVQFGDMMAALVACGRGIAVMFDGALSARLKEQVTRIPVDLGHCYRVMAKGEKMNDPAATPVLSFFRELFAWKKRRGKAVRCNAARLGQRSSPGTWFSRTEAKLREAWPCRRLLACGSQTHPSTTLADYSGADRMVCSRSADKVDPVAWRGGQRWLAG